MNWPRWFRRRAAETDLTPAEAAAWLATFTENAKTIGSAQRLMLRRIVVLLEGQETPRGQIQSQSVVHE